MTMYLPRLHRQMVYDLKPVRGSTIQRSGTGGSLSPLNRLGDHWAVEIDAGTMSALCGRGLLADIVRGTSERIVVPLPQHGIDLGSPRSTPVPFSDGAYFSDGAGFVTSPYVASSGQAGNTLALLGVMPNYVARKGFFFTLKMKPVWDPIAGESSPWSYSAHIITETSVANSEGELSLSFWPMLWLQPNEMDEVELLNPFLAGYIVDDGGQSMGLFSSVRTDSFLIEEG